MEIFGFQIQRLAPKITEDPTIGYVAEDHEDGAVTVAAGGAYASYVDLDGTVRNEVELITKYRDMALQAECDIAVEDIVNEVITKDDDSPIIKIELSALENDLSPQIIEIISAEFDKIKDMLEIETYGYEIFRRWFVDGRMNYQVMIDPKAPEEGIVGLKYIDSRKIRKIREVIPTRIPNSSLNVNVEGDEYYIYSDRGFSNAAAYQYQSAGQIRIAKDAIVTINSGIVDKEGKMVLSYLHKAIKPLNQLQMLENATIIYHLARAPERKAFYIDVGNLPKMKAEQYVRDLMVKYKNRLVYDSATGQVKDDRKFMTMTEDFWLPRREGGKGTDIQVIQGAQNLQDMANFVEFFKEKMYQSLNVPISRLQPDNGFNLGRASEITRDELKFQKFISRLRSRFSELFYECLGKQLVLKQVMALEEWEVYRKKIFFKYARDNYFAELKNMEILREKFATLNQVVPFLDILFSAEWIYEKVLLMKPEEWEVIQEQIAASVGSQGFRPGTPAHAGDVDAKTQAAAAKRKT